jgi:hypothetical protein
MCSVALWPFMSERAIVPNNEPMVRQLSLVAWIQS